jgi:hypothetical protein
MEEEGEEEERKTHSPPPRPKPLLRTPQIELQQRVHARVDVEAHPLRVPLEPVRVEALRDEVRLACVFIG